MRRCLLWLTCGLAVLRGCDFFCLRVFLQADEAATSDLAQATVDCKFNPSNEGAVVRGQEQGGLSYLIDVAHPAKRDLRGNRGFELSSLFFG